MPLQYQILPPCQYFSLGRAGVADPGLICLCFAGQNLFPTIKIVSEEGES